MPKSKRNTIDVHNFTKKRLEQRLYYLNELDQVIATDMKNVLSIHLSIVGPVSKIDFNLRHLNKSDLLAIISYIHNKVKDRLAKVTEEIADLSG